MKKIGCVAILLVLGLSFGIPLMGQEKQPPPPPPKIVTLKVDVVVSEYEGAKKISSLPYSFYVNTDEPRGNDTARIRVGLRVPVFTGTGTGGANQFQYMDIGTNVDCKAQGAGDGRYRLELSVERSYVYTAGQDEKRPIEGGMTLSSGNPVVGRLNSSYNLYIKDGQTIEATSTTDPVSGRVLKVSVTVNSVK
jgi:hypothetical protein